MAIHTLAIVLMPVSQAAAWYGVFKKPLYPTVALFALFYALWAMYNRFLDGDDSELGMISMGLLALAAYYEHREFSMAACVLVLVNFLYPAYYVLLQWNAVTLLAKVKGPVLNPIKGLVWAYMFKLYFVSNIGLWGTVLYKMYKKEDNGSASGYLPISMPWSR